MRDLLRLAAHIAGIALTSSLIPLAAVLMLTDHKAWGAVCLGAALAAIVLAARLDHRAHEPATRKVGGPVHGGWPVFIGDLPAEPDPVDAHFADTARALNTPTMRLPAAAGPTPGRRPAPSPPVNPPAPPQPKVDRLPSGMCVYDSNHTPPVPWFPHTGEVPHV